MANTSLPDLTERTATSDSDLIHVNSGGSDYKQTKANFLKGDFQHIFNNTSALTAQVDALPVGTFFGSISAYGSQTATGLPINANCYVKATKMSATTASIEIWSLADVEGQHYITTKTSNTWGSWVHVPNRSEITSLNNSLANIRTNGQFLGYRDKYTTNISISSDNSYARIGDVYDDFGVPSGAYIINFSIRGWSGASGTLMLMAGSDGKTIYVMSNKAGKIGSITVRVWYAILN